MWTLEKSFRFEAAHRLPNHDGKCARLHGHSWVARLVVRGAALATEGPKAGMVMDYSELADAMRPLLEDHLDHHYLNESLVGIDPVVAACPTSERIAEMIAERMRDALGTQVEAVTVEETCTARCTFRFGRVEQER